jgi:hypothetical protein
MSRFYRKPKPETMKKNRELYREAYKDEIAWMKVNVSSIIKHNKFLNDMYMILVTGSRKITPKMESAIRGGVEKCKNSPLYNEELREEADKKLKPILDKIKMVKSLAEQKGDYGLDFIDNVENYVKNNHRITKKQMTALNKVYKRCSEDLFDGISDEVREHMVKQIEKQIGENDEDIS